MAEALIKVLIENLTSFLKGELVLLFGFENKFQSFQAYAQEKQLNYKPLENWLQKLNVATYEVDNILNEYKTKATRFSLSAYGRYHPKVIPFRHRVGKRMDHEDEIVKILINNVSDAQNFSVLPILGMGGLGKTTLAQMVFNNQRVTEHFYRNIWICVSDYFDEKRLIEAIELLNGKRYLLVLDDVWNEDQEKWANLTAALKVGASGASVLTTTRLEKGWINYGNNMQPYELSNLSQEDCWLLFIHSAFGHQEEINPNLVAIGKEIVKKCGGVPLEAMTLGGILRFKREEREWEHVRDSEIWNLSQDKSSILHVLRLMKKDTEATEANLSAKMNLHSLSMSWDDDEPHIYESEEPNLKYFVISGFRGFRFPYWMNHLVLKNVVSILMDVLTFCINIYIPKRYL
ncbi:hypothetical protein R3W88_022847 [Solanum pinnatisectum]|uniref:NB-ARC domain-containing protein n=1 Tax=Solanum pinnatisectum TaxID=50273 RepID=A0AAV9LZ50_9SOLN|nr:hypothetical protein R3W88_022847 [Solanum pinnatisectum]